MVEYSDIIRELYYLLCNYDNTIDDFKEYEDNKEVKHYININKKAKKILLDKFGDEIEKYIEDEKGRR